MRNGILLLFILFIAGCKKNNTPPELTLKSGAGYTTSNISVTPGSAFVVHIIANKGSDELSLVYTEVAFDGANTTRLVSRIFLGPQERSHYERDITVNTRIQSGTERWVFDVNDAEGRISKQEIRVTVQ